MVKKFKEYLGLPTIAIGGLDSYSPMVSLGKQDDRPPKGKGSRDSRAVGLVANYTSQGVGTINPILTNPTKPIIVKKEEVSLNDIKSAAKRFAKGIYDKLKRIATTSKRYEYAAKVLQDVIDRKKRERAKEGLPLRHDIGYYSAAVADTFKDIDPKRLVKMVHEELSPFKKKILQKLSKPIKDYNKKKEKKEDGMTGPGMGTMNAMPSIVNRKIKESALYKHMQKKGIIR